MFEPPVLKRTHESAVVLVHTWRHIARGLAEQVITWQIAAMSIGVQRPTSTFIRNSRTPCGEHCKRSVCHAVSVTSRPTYTVICARRRRARDSVKRSERPSLRVDCGQKGQRAACYARSIPFDPAPYIEINYRIRDTAIWYVSHSD
jgi:hypothetical protein